MRLYEMEKQGVCKKHFKKMLKRSMQLYEMEQKEWAKDISKMY